MTHFFVKFSETKTKDSFKLDIKYLKTLKDLISTLEIESDG